MCVYVRAFGLTNAAFNTPPCCHLRRLNTFRRYLTNGTIFGKKLPNIKCVFCFSVQILFETFLVVRIIQRDIVTNVETSLCKVHVMLVGF